MISENTKKISYFIPRVDVIELGTLPNTCPVCFRPVEEPVIDSIERMENSLTKVFFKCSYKDCKSTFSTKYIKDVEKENAYHFISFYLAHKLVK
jgi:hypothetical protein